MDPEAKLAELEAQILALREELAAVRAAARETTNVETRIYGALLEHRRETREILFRMVVDASAWRNENRGAFVALGVLFFLGWLVRQGTLRGAEIAALAAALLGSLGVFLRQVGMRARREKDSIVPGPPS